MGMAVPIHLIKVTFYANSNEHLKIMFIFTALSSAQRRLSNTLLNFKFECIGNQQTDDEIIIAGYAQYFLFTLVKIFNIL